MFLRNRVPFGIFQRQVPGSASLTCADATLTGAGSLTRHGSASLTCADATLTGAGSLTYHGTASLICADAIVTGAGSLTYYGSASLTCADATLTGVGSLVHVGSASLICADATCSGAGGALRYAIGTAFDSVLTESDVMDDWQLSATIAEFEKYLAEVGSKVASYLVGNVIVLTFRVWSRTVGRVDPVTVTLTIQDPSGSQTTPFPSKVSEGSYQYLFDTEAADPGTYLYRWQGDGTYEVAREGSFEVAASSLAP